MNDEAPNTEPDPETALQQLQNGIFTMVVSMVRTLEAQGVSTVTARGVTAKYLESLLSGLAPPPPPQTGETPT